MTILAIFKANGITKEMYEELRKEVDLGTPTTGWDNMLPFLLQDL
jgi:hypothetical protein